MWSSTLPLTRHWDPTREVAAEAIVAPTHPLRFGELGSHFSRLSSRVQAERFGRLCKRGCGERSVVVQPRAIGRNLRNDRTLPLVLKLLREAPLHHIEHGVHRG